MQNHSAALNSHIPPNIFAQVSKLKNNWGLIRAVERPLDLFFHFSSLADGLEGSLKVGLTSHDFRPHDM